MVREHSLYQMAGSMQGNTSRVNRMVKVYSFMLMEKNLLGNTRMEKLGTAYYSTNTET